MKPKKITMVNTGQIAKRGWKGLKTPQAVKNFATKHKVPYVYWKQPGSTQKYFLVEYDAFCDTWREWKKTGTPATGRTAVSKPTTQRTRTTSTTKTTYKRTARTPITRTATSRTTPKKRTTTYKTRTRTRR